MQYSEDELKTTPTYGTYVLMLDGKISCARKEQTLLFDLTKALYLIEGSRKSFFFYGKKLCSLICAKS